jgi:hypothetical protein
LAWRSAALGDYERFGLFSTAARHGDGRHTANGSRSASRSSG